MSDIQPFSPKDVYFLGAGSSAIVGIPTFGDFRKKAEEICKIKLSDDIPKKELFEKILKDWIDNFSEFNIEQYFAAIEMLEKLSSVDIGNITTNEVKKFISYTIEKSLINKSHIKSYEEIFHHLSRNGVSRSAFITTNWDIVLETSTFFSLASNWIIYEGAQPYHTNESVTHDTQFHILKLHGSFNWGYCKSCDKIYYFEEMYDSERLSKITCPACVGKLGTVVIPPTLSKLSNSAPQLINIWRNAYKYIRTCEKIYFIGYSFPLTDVEMEVFISNALRNNSKLDEVIIVSNEKHTESKINFEKRYRSIIPKRIKDSQIKYHYDGFEHFYEKLPENPPTMGNVQEW